MSRTLPPTTVTDMPGSGVGGGPAMTAPVEASYSPPWHGQMKRPPFWSYSTVHPACVHTALNARKSPLRSCTSHAGALLLSWKPTADPTGTADAAVMTRPVGAARFDFDDCGEGVPVSTGAGCVVAAEDECASRRIGVASSRDACAS